MTNTVKQLKMLDLNMVETAGGQHCSNEGRQNGAGRKVNGSNPRLGKIFLSKSLKSSPVPSSPVLLFHQ